MQLKSLSILCFRESVGECLCGMVLSGDGDVNNSDEDSAMLTFQRHKNNHWLVIMQTGLCNMQQFLKAVKMIIFR